MDNNQPLMSIPLEDFYQRDHKMYVATDCIIFGFDSRELKLLIFKRNVAPLKGKWSLIGSFVKLDESIAEAAKRVLKQTTGLTKVFMEELKVYGDVERDPGFRCISIAKYALIRIDSFDHKLTAEYGASWHSIPNLPELILDHEQMITDALEKLKDIARTRPIGFELLPEKFTIPDLQKLYEVLYQKKFDARNFRKKILSLDLLHKLNEKDKTNSKKGAYLYRFDSKKYRALVDLGFNFEI